jgi:hypothetical protein
MAALYSQTKSDGPPYCGRIHTLPRVAVGVSPAVEGGVPPPGFAPFGAVCGCSPLLPNMRVACVKLTHNA